MIHILLCSLPIYIVSHNNSVKLSLIIPYFNAERYIKRTIQSITSANQSAIELILVSDGSVDNSNFIVENIIENSQAKWLHNVILPVHCGTLCARQRGFQQATGEYIWHIDADDLIPEGAIQQILSRLSSEKPDLLHFNEETVRISELGDWQREPDGFSNQMPSSSIDRKRIYLYGPHLHAKVFSAALMAKIFRNLGPGILAQNISYCDDCLIMFAGYYLSQSYMKAEFTGYYYVQTQDSMMRRSYEFKILQDLLTVYLHLEKIGFILDIEGFWRRIEDNFITILSTFHTNANAILCGHAKSLTKQSKYLRFSQFEQELQLSCGE